MKEQYWCDKLALLLYRFDSSVCIDFTEILSLYFQVAETVKCETLMSSGDECQQKCNNHLLWRFVNVSIILVVKYFHLFVKWVVQRPK